MSFGYSTPGPVLQLVVIETHTFGSPGMLVFEALVLLGIGAEVAETISTVAVSDAVASGVGVSVSASVLVDVGESVGVWDAVSVGGGSLVKV